MKRTPVEVCFYDHAQNVKKPMKCYVWGNLLEDNPMFVKVAVWDLENPEVRENNQDSYVILKSAILHIKKFSLTCNCPQSNPEPSE